MRGNATGLAIQIFPIRKQVVLHTQKRSARLSDLFLVALSDVGSIGSANVCRGRPEAQVASRYAATPLKGLLRPHMSMAATSRVRNAVQRSIEAKTTEYTRMSTEIYTEYTNFNFFDENSVPLDPPLNS